MAEKAPKLKWNQHAEGDDISYLGPLSYRHFKIIGWLLLVIKLLLPPIALVAKIDPTVGGSLATPLGVLELITPLSVFFLLLASFSQMLIKHDYKNQMIVYGGAALAIIVVFELLYHRYVVSSVDAFVENRDQALAMCDAAFSMLNSAGFIAFNVFIDLFLCTSVMFFLNYEPTKIFVGEKRKYFRYLTVLPVIFELVCLYLKVQANSGGFHLPISFFPFLPTKPPMMFFALCGMIVYHTVLEKRFRKEGRSHEEYMAYLETNRNCWDFAKYAAVVCLLAGILDVVIANAVIAMDEGGGLQAVVELWSDGQGAWLYRVVNKYLNAGFGGSAQLILFAPIMLLFNYMKTYKNTLVELAIPVGAITLLLILYLEGGLLLIGEIARFAKNEVVTTAKEQVLPAIAQMAEEADEYMDETDRENFMHLMEELGVSEEDLARIYSSSGAQTQELAKDSGSASSSSSAKDSGSAKSSSSAKSSGSAKSSSSAKGAPAQAPA